MRVAAYVMAVSRLLLPTVLADTKFWVEAARFLMAALLIPPIEDRQLLRHKASVKD